MDGFSSSFDFFPAVTGQNKAFRKVEGLQCSSHAFDFAVAGFRVGDFFGRAGFAALKGLAEGLERRGGFLAALDAGFIFRVGMRRSSA